MRKETFHTFNRILSLLLIPISFLFPLFISSSNPDTLLIPSPDYAFQYSFPVILLIAFIVYLAGFSICLVLMIISYVKLIRKLLPKGNPSSLLYIRKIPYTKTRLIVLRQSCAAFSWMRNVVISEEDLKENPRVILMHEFEHIRSGHSWDILFMDLLCIIQWFNPAAWLLKSSMQQIHEFSVDKAVIKKGINTKAYQLLLISKASSRCLYPMINSFNSSLIKDRLTMMLKRPSAKCSSFKALYVLPIILLISLFFSMPKIQDCFSNIFYFTANEVFNEAPLYIMNGKIVNSDKILLEVIDNIESVKALDGKSAVETYGTRAKNGVMDIKLKK